MPTTDALPERAFRCRLEEVGPVARLAYARYQKNRADFVDASTDFGDAFDLDFGRKQEAFEKLVPTRQRIVSAAEQTRRINTAAKALRQPLNLLDIQIGAAARAKTLTVAAKDMGLKQVRNEISTRDMEGLDKALGELIGLVVANQSALTDKGMKVKTLQDLRDARTSLGLSNTDQDGGRLDQVELTAENVKAGNALWELVTEILRVGKLLYRETNKKRADGFSLARLKKLMRSANAGGAGAADDEAPDAPSNG